MDASTGQTARVAVVKWAGSGSGKAATRLMLDEGCRVVLAGRRLQPLLDSADGRPRAHCVVCDVAEADDVERLFAGAIQRFESVDVLFNSAGTFGTSDSVDEIALGEWGPRWPST